MKTFFMRSSFRLFATFVSLVFFAIPAVFFRMLTPSPALARDDSSQKSVAVNAVNSLAVDLYKKLSSSDANLCFSPYSVSSAFAMTYAGAAGDTAKEMEEGFHYGSGIHDSFGALTKNLLQNPAEAGRLDIANSIWPQKGYRFRKKYLAQLRKDYRVRAVPLDFIREKEHARTTINDWVAERTGGRIRDILSSGSISEETKLVLVNAIYFKASWLDKFDDRATKDADFFPAPGRKTSVRMMNRTAEMEYAELEGLQVVRLPYAGGAYSMQLVLPRERDGIANIERRLSTVFLDSLDSSLKRRRVDLSLPKFKIESAFDLVRASQALGVKSAFGPGADFSGMNGNRELFISAAIHKAFVEVEEKGTEAAAATAVVMTRTSAMQPQEAVVFRADHPFLFMIRDNTSGAILFMGKVMEP